MILTVLSGSDNYNLSINNEKGYKKFLLPSLNDLVSGRDFLKNYVTDSEDSSYHDVRKLIHELKAKKLNYLEVLFSEEVQFNSSLTAFEGSVLLKLFEYRETIVRSNLERLYTTMMNEYFQQKSFIYRSTSRNETFINEYGYDVRSAFQAQKLLFILERYANSNFSNFKNAIWFETEGEHYQLLMKIRQGQVSSKEIGRELDRYKQRIDRKYAQLYKTFPKNDELLDELTTDIEQLIIHNLKKELAD